MDRVAKVLIDLDADIINLNEVEDCAILDELLARFPKDHGYRYYMVQGQDTATGQNPAILTRIDPIMNLKYSSIRIEYPVEGSTCDYSIIGHTGCTKHYLTRFIVQNGADVKTSLLMAGLHLLSKPHDKYRCGRREAQAKIISSFVVKHREPGDKIILAGDFNDYDNEVPGPNDDQSISNTVGSLKTDLDLKNVAEIVPQNERYSCWFDKDQNCIDNGIEEHTLIDHVLVSRDLQIKQAYFYHAYKVSCRDRVSDHWPFKMTIDLRT